MPRSLLPNSSNLHPLRRRDPSLHPLPPRRLPCKRLLDYHHNSSFTRTPPPTSQLPPVRTQRMLPRHLPLRNRKRLPNLPRTRKLSLKSNSSSQPKLIRNHTLMVSQRPPPRNRHLHLLRTPRSLPNPRSLPRSPSQHLLPPKRSPPNTRTLPQPTSNCKHLLDCHHSSFTRRPRPTSQLLLGQTRILRRPLVKNRRRLPHLQMDRPPPNLPRSRRPSLNLPRSRSLLPNLPRTRPRPANRSPRLLMSSLRPLQTSPLKRRHLLPAKPQQNRKLHQASLRSLPTNPLRRRQSLQASLRSLPTSPLKRRQLLQVSPRLSRKLHQASLQQNRLLPQDSPLIRRLPPKKVRNRPPLRPSHPATWYLRSRQSPMAPPQMQPSQLLRS